MRALALIAWLAADPAAVERPQPHPPEVEPDCKQLLRTAGARFPTPTWSASSSLRPAARVME
jgi:hypothetical protein